MGLIFQRYLYVVFVVLLAMSLFFAIFTMPVYQANIDSTGGDVIYSIANNSETIDFERGFLITIRPSKGVYFSKFIYISIPTNLTEGSKITVSIVASDGNIRKLLMTRVKNHRISFYTKRAGTFQIMKIGN